ncbi:MAG: SMP-30/gluconolactonase/LRE family protein [Acidimicrobiia bacterium]|nr:SMP-30/gluconolactonase/LRE family protein [Acidimicrobiia bacterium]
MEPVEIIADGLRFPEGPVVLDDGSLVVTEIERGTLTRIDPATGASEVLADCGGGPNGAALGADGQLYVTNNGGFFEWLDTGELIIPGARHADHVGGSIQRVDLATGAVTTLYEEADGQRLVAPNDLVVAADGHLYFTDFGVQHDTDFADRPGLWRAALDGSSLTPVVWGTHQANGVGLSPDGRVLYAAETHDGRLWAWDVADDGTVPTGGAPGQVHEGRLLHDTDGLLFDSLGVDGGGWVCVASIGPGGGVTCVAPDGSASERVEAPDDLTTNICFAGDVAYLTLSSTGRVARIAGWPR